MTIFLLLAIYLIIVSFAIPEAEKKKKSLWAAFGFVIILCLRSPYCGLDVTGATGMIMSNSYGGVFLSMPNYSFGDIIRNPEYVGGHMEVGWLLLAKTISLFTHNLQVYLVIISILQFLPIAYVIRKYSSNVVLSYFVFASLGFFVHYFSGIRQMLAVSIILLAFDQLYQKRYLWYTAIVLIASTIHSSAILFLIVWPLSKIRLSFLTAIISIAIMVAIMPLYQAILSDVLELFFESRYEGYLNAEGSATTMFLVYALFLLLSFLQKEDTPKIRLLRVLLLVGVAGQSLGVLGNSAITRIGYYFNIFLILLLPEIVMAFKRKNELDIIIAGAVILLCAFFVLTTNSENSSGVIPYEFFWNNPAK